MQIRKKNVDNKSVIGKPKKKRKKKLKTKYTYNSRRISMYKEVRNENQVFSQILSIYQV